MNNFTNKFQNVVTKYFPIVLILLGMSLSAMASSWTQRQKITSTPRGVGAQHGNAVAISGNTMVVGAQFDGTTASQAGTAYVYVLSGAIWTQQAVLLANDGAVADKFGYSVAINENTIVVGAFNDDSPLSNAGSAYVFVRSGTTWTFQQKLTGSDSTADDQFGSSVAVTGDSIIVGANHADLPGNSEAGSAYFYRRSGTVWTFQQKLIPVQGANGVILGDHFGDSAAISGNKIAIGASGDDNPFTSAGAVYVFVESGGTYTLQQKITIPSGANGDDFGFSVAIEGNTLVGGALQYTPIISQPAYGAAYVYEFNGSSWVSQGRLTASDGASFDRFGYSVAVSNNVVAVGAREDDTAAGGDAGSAYIFTRTGATWTEQQKIAPSDTFNGDRFGVSVALSFGNLVVGAAEKALTNPNGQGAVYYFTQINKTLFDFDGDRKSDISVYRPSSGIWFLLKSQGGVSITQFGISTDRITPTDFDGDGKTDITVYRDGIWYLLQSTNGFTAVNFGLAEDLPVPADYDGDGKADIAVYRPSNGTWYFLNSSNNNAFSAVQFGISEDKPTLGDFDGDGRSDIAVYRPSSGMWFRLNSSNGQFSGYQFGIAEDKPTPADYDGDGKADIAVYRPSNGVWYRLNSSNNQFVAVQFGLAEDKPAPADYDGDGKADQAVFRPSNGVWYLLNSTTGFTAQQFGIAEDKPAPNAFIR